MMILWQDGFLTEAQIVSALQFEGDAAEQAADLADLRAFKTLWQNAIDREKFERVAMALFYLAWDKKHSGNPNGYFNLAIRANFNAVLTSI
jgi:hypothetical protein